MLDTSDDPEFISLSDLIHQLYEKVSDIEGIEKGTELLDSFNNAAQNARCLAGINALDDAFRICSLMMKVKTILSFAIQDIETMDRRQINVLLKTVDVLSDTTAATAAKTAKVP